MSDLTWLAIPLGIGLLGVALLDVFLTVLHIQAQSPISARLHRGMWRLFLWASRALPPGLRGEVLAWGAPLMIGGLPVLWLILCIAGFGALYVPVIEDPRAFRIAQDTPSAPVANAVYFSAVTFLTVGYGGIVPLYPLGRLLTFVEGATGLLTISLAVTYLLSVYPMIARKMVVATTLNQETAGRSHGVALATRYLAVGRDDALGERMRWINDELLALGQAHGLYPVMYYVRPREVQHSFVRILAVVQGIVGTLRYTLDPEAHRPVVNDPRLLTLEEGLLQTLHAVANSYHLTPKGESSWDEEGARNSFHLQIEELRRGGLTPLLAAADAEAAFCRFRAATDPVIRAYALNVGYDIDAVWAVYGRRARDAAPTVAEGIDIPRADDHPTVRKPTAPRDRRG